MSEKTWIFSDLGAQGRENLRQIEAWKPATKQVFIQYSQV